MPERIQNRFNVGDRVKVVEVEGEPTFFNLPPEPENIGHIFVVRAVYTYYNFDADYLLDRVDDEGVTIEAEITSECYLQGVDDGV